MDRIDRRQFLNRSRQASFGLAAGFAGAQVVRASQRLERAKKPKIGAFTKSFQDRSIPEVCRLFHEIGLDGLDLTVRPGGHIEPANVTVELPLAVKAARDNDLEILFLTTAITDDDEAAKRVLATAAEQGIDRVKMGYYRYEQFGTLAKKIKMIRSRIAKVARLADRYDVLPCVHIHSGRTIPSHGTQLYEIIRDFSPQEVGAYVDPLHMTLEGGGDGWRQGLDLLAPWIALVAVKNFAWHSGERDDKGQLRWHTKKVPIADGVCPLPAFIATLKQIGYAGTYSLHSEYKGAHSFQNLDTDGCLRQTALDLKYLRTLL